jgi:hypothetical protein
MSYAFEGRCFVLAVGLMMPIRDLPSCKPEQTFRIKKGNGWSAVAARLLRPAPATSWNGTCI